MIECQVVACGKAGNFIIYISFNHFDICINVCYNHLDQVPAVVKEHSQNITTFCENCQIKHKI